MSILFDEGQRAIADESRRFARAHVDKARQLALLEAPGDFDRTFWDGAVAQGWTALAVPEAQGGMGLGLVELGIVSQAAGEVAAGLPFLAAAEGLRVALGAGDAAEWLPRLAAGEALAAIAFAAGGEPLPLAPPVRFEDGNLSGTATGVAGGLHADVALVYASGNDGPVLALASLDGVAREPVDGFDNGRGHADLAFAQTPAKVLATGDAARALAVSVLAQMAVVVAHEQIGGAEALLLQARDYAVTRRAFGQPIGAFQSVKHRLAELWGLVELARANAVHAASIAGTPGFVRAAAAARLSATEAYDTAARDCVQIHGGIGVTWEGGLHLHMRRARSLASELGHALFWEDLLVDELTGASA